MAYVEGKSVEKERCFRGKEGVERALLLLRGKKTLKNAKKSGKKKERF
jgi:hypothetical protein